MPKLTFYYFAFPHINRGECIRYLLHYLQIPFDDERVYSYTPRPEGTVEYPKVSQYRQLPVLKVTEKSGSEVTIPQGPAICQYVSDIGGVSLTPMERANAMHLAQAAEDLRIRLVQGVFGGDEARKRFVDSVAARHFKQFETILESSKEEFFYSSKATFGDICVADAVETVEDYIPGLLAQYPKLEKHLAAVLALPGIAEYKTTCPKKNSAKDRPKSLI